MIISLIAAIDEQGGIGKQNQLPWYLHSDLRRFKTLTMGHHLVMGRKTYETIGRPLPGRVMIVLTRRMDYHPEGCLVANSVESAINLAKKEHEAELFIIGGGEIFAQSINIAEKIYLTSVHADVTADIFFPKIIESEWDVIYEEKHIRHEKDQYASDFKILVRNKVNRVDKIVKPHIIRQT